jgi:signal transduction histidine kinase
MVIAAIAVLGYAYGAFSLYRLGHTFPMSINTATVFLVVAVGLLGLRPQVGPVSIVTTADLGGVGARRLLASVVLIPFALGAVWAWAEAADVVDGAVGVAGFVILTSLLLAVAVLSMARTISRLASALEQDGRELEAARHTAEAANRAKSEFLAGMGHELRTPLNAIIGFSELIADGGADRAELERHAEYAHYINSGGHQLLRIIDAVLDMALMESGRFALTRRSCDVATAVATALASVRDLAEANAVTLIELIPAHLPPIDADEPALQQVLANLLSNAVKFTSPGGTVTVFGEALAGGGPNGSVVIRVADTGIGMSPPEIARALMPFARVDGSLQRAHGGAGLGLPLARQLVELHGGRLEVESEPGAGTVVRAHFSV